MGCSIIRRNRGRLAAVPHEQRPGRHVVRPGEGNALTMTAGPPPPRRVTIREIAAERRISARTIRRHHSRDEHWPPAAGPRRTGRRGRPELEWDADPVDEYYKLKEAASPQARRGPRRGDGDWDRDELVDAATAANRLGISESAFRGYPAGTKDSSNPLPPADPRGRWPWRVVADWDDQRQGSGNRLPRARAADGASGG
jgi:hypothetical protein